MGVFTRTRDIVNANVNAMLDKAENPEKMVRFMAREMEETLGRVKVARDGALAARRDIEIELERVRERAEVWAGTVQGAKIELTTDVVARTTTSELNYTGGRRLYGNVEGDLLWTLDRATTEVDLQPYMWARLTRA